MVINCVISPGGDVYNVKPGDHLIKVAYETGYQAYSQAFYDYLDGTSDVDPGGVMKQPYEYATNQNGWITVSRWPMGKTVNIRRIGPTTINSSMKLESIIDEIKAHEPDIDIEIT